MSAFLELEDGTRFYGHSFGSNSSVSGEVVFNTGMVGYTESLTDPSYKGQVLVLTYPLVGNYGVPQAELDTNKLLKIFESGKIQVSGLIVANYSDDYSHFAAKRSLSEWLKSENIPAITGIDTRALTKKLREKGVMLGKIIASDKDVKIEDPNLRNLAGEVCIKEKTVYNQDGKSTVVVVDCGVKNNIIRNLITRNCKVIRVPSDFDFTQLDYDALVIGNGPGDPKMCVDAIKNTRIAMEKEKPIFGICLGNQIMALAAGGDTYKLKYGHRGQNQPCIMQGTERCFITSQNHGFAVNSKTMPSGWEESFINANDGTNEGLRHKSKPFFSVQFHPEGCSGPEDTNFLFDDFLRTI